MHLIFLVVNDVKIESVAWENCWCKPISYFLFSLDRRYLLKIRPQHFTDHIQILVLGSETKPTNIITILHNLQTFSRNKCMRGVGLNVAADSWLVYLIAKEEWDYDAEVVREIIDNLPDLSFAFGIFITGRMDFCELAYWDLG